MTRAPLLALLFAAPIVAAATDHKAAVADAISALGGNASRSVVVETPINGLKEVRVDGQVVYVSEDGKYLIAGDLIDVKSKINLSDITRSELRAKTLRDAPQGERIVYGDPKSAKKLYVFTDTSCGYCAKFHDEVPALNAAGVTVEYLAWPRGGPRSEAYTDMISVWCSADRKAAYGKVIKGGQVASVTCSHPIRSSYELGESLGVNATPAIFDASGRQLGGYLPAAQVLKAMQNGVRNE